MITRMVLTNFTGFSDADINCAAGVNVFIGKNGTGKTHLLKLLYTTIAALNEGKRVSDKIVEVFLPTGKNIGRLVKRTNKSSEARIQVWRRNPGSNNGAKRLSLHFSNHTKDTLKWSNGWKSEKIGRAVYIPVKEMLANAPNFISLYEKYDLHFEAVYADIVHYANMPILRRKHDPRRAKLLRILQQAIEGRVVQKGEAFYLKSAHGQLEFTLLAEGVRKLGLLWLLINNGSLFRGSYLFWDEPEANLNPTLMKTVVQILLELGKMGVQVFLATHSYVLLKEIDLHAGKDSSVMFHSLFRDRAKDGIGTNTTKKYLDIDPNAIDDAFGDLTDREIKRSMGG